MANNEVKLIISADGSTVVKAAQEVSQALDTLKVKTLADINQQKANTEAAYNTIKSSGIASAKEIAQAETAKKDRLAALNKEILNSATSMVDRVKACWVNVSAAAIGAYAAFSKVNEYRLLGAQAEQAERAFRSMAAASNESADSIIADLKRVTQGTVDDSDMQQKAAKAMALDFSGEQIIKMASAARSSAVLTGQSVGDTFSTIADGIATNMPRSLKQMGLVTKEQMELIQKAAAAGITDIKLYDIAMANAAEQQAKLGLSALSTYEKMQQSHAAIKNMEEAFGSLVNKAIPYVIAGFLSVGQAVMIGIGTPILMLNEAIKAVTGKSEGFVNEMALTVESILKEQAQLKAKLLGEDTSGTQQSPDAVRLAKEKADKQTAELKKQIDFQNSLTVVAKLYEARIALEKSLMTTDKMQWDQHAAGLKASQEMLLISDEAYYAAERQGFAEELQDAQGHLIKIKELTTKTMAAKIAAESTKGAKANQEAIKAMRLDLAAQLQEMNNQITQQALTYKGTVDKSEYEETKKRRDQQKNELVNMLAFELEVKNTMRQQDFAAQTDNLKKEEEALKYNYEQGLVSGTNYYSELRRLAEKTLAIKQTLSGQELQAAETKMTTLLEQSRITYEEQMKYQEEYIKAVLKYNGDIEASARELKDKLVSINREASKTFETGWASGMAAYVKTTEWGFDKAKALASETANALSNSFTDMFFGNFKKGMQGLKDYFVNLLKQMVASAIANPIVVPISAAIKSAMSGTSSSDGSSWLSSLFSSSSSSSGNYGQTTNTTLGNTDTSMFNLANPQNSSSSGYDVSTTIGTASNPAAVSIVGVAGAALTLFSGVYGGVKAAGLTKESGAMAGMGAGAAMGAGATALYGATTGAFAGPMGIVLGAAIGLLVGGIAGWLGGGKKSAINMFYKPGVTTAEDLTATGWQGKQAVGSTGLYAGLAQHGADVGEISSQFQKLGDTTYKVFSALNLDISGFSKTWTYYKKNLSGMTDAEMTTLMGEITTSFMKSITGVDFTQFQASGEKVTDTITKILTAMQYVVSVSSGWDTATKSGWDISKMYENIDITANTYKESLTKTDSQIKTNIEDMKTLTGADWATKLSETGALIKTRYDQEISYLTYIKQMQSDIEKQITGMIETIALDAKSGGEKMSWYFDKATTAWTTLQAATDPTKIKEAATNLLSYVSTLYSAMKQLKSDLLTTAQGYQYLAESIKTSGMSTGEKLGYYASQALQPYIDFMAASAAWQDTGMANSLTEMDKMNTAAKDLATPLKNLYNEFKNLSSAAKSVADNAKSLKDKMEVSTLSGSEKNTYYNTQWNKELDNYNKIKADATAQLAIYTAATSSDAEKAAAWKAMVAYATKFTTSGQKLTDIANTATSGMSAEDIKTTYGNMTSDLNTIATDMTTVSTWADTWASTIGTLADSISSALTKATDSITGYLTTISTALTTINTSIQDKLTLAIAGEILALENLTQQIAKINWSALGGTGAATTTSNTSKVGQYTVDSSGHMALNDMSGTTKYTTELGAQSAGAQYGMVTYDTTTGGLTFGNTGYTLNPSDFTTDASGNIHLNNGVVLTAHEKGLDYVPYDNYPASLHRGESVLTSSGNAALDRLITKIDRLETQNNRKDDTPIKVYISGDAAGFVKVTADKAVQIIRQNPAVLERR